MTTWPLVRFNRVEEDAPAPAPDGVIVVRPGDSFAFDRWRFYGPAEVRITEYRDGTQFIEALLGP